MSVADSRMPAEGSARDREIVAARVVVTCPGRNFVTLKVETRSGVCGLGDATLNGRELAVAAYLGRTSRTQSDGRESGRIEDILAVFLSRRLLAARTGDDDGDRSRRCRVVGHPWQVRGSAAVPILGGRSRKGALVYGHANGRDIAETSAEVGRFVSMGYRAVRAQCGVPGLKKPYGISSARNLRTGRERAAGRDRLVDTEVPRRGAETIRTTAGTIMAPTSSCCMTFTTA